MGAFVVIILLSMGIWFYVNKFVEDNRTQAKVEHNQAIAQSLAAMWENKDNKRGTKNHAKFLSLIEELYSAYKLKTINIIKGTEIISSTVKSNVGKNISTVVLPSIKAVEVKNVVLDSKENAIKHSVSIHSIVSYIALNNKNENLVLQVVSDVAVNDTNTLNIKYLMLAGIIAGAIVLLFIFYFILKYSDNLVNKYAKQIVTQAKSDPTTGLLNRHHFFRLIRRSITKTVQQNARAALFIVDIDHFKELNAKYDHSFGDEVLKIMVNRLTKLIESTDTVARTGDDEFSILIEQSGSNTSVQDYAKKILAAVNEPIQIDASYIHLTCSIGISIVNQDAKDMEELIHHADSALYNAKDFGRNNFQVFSRGGGVRHLKFYDKQYALNKALDEDEYIIYIQPKIIGSTGEIVGGEALLRWVNPDYGMVPPLEFLPALEKSGLIHGVGDWVLKESCRISKYLQEKTGNLLPISVNVSALQFKNDEFIANVAESLSKADLDGSMLELELTETCLMENVEYSLLVLEDLKKMGIRIAIDDFGTGYSSLNYLKRFPIDTLKIDRSFVTDVHDRSSNDNAAIVTAIMALSHSLHIETVAEGVEQPHELAYLDALGCKVVQGFLFSEPLPVDEYLELLKDNKKITDKLEQARKKLAQ